MKLCQIAHDPIIYDGDICPLCDALETIKEWRKTFITLEQNYEELLEKQKE